MTQEIKLKTMVEYLRRTRYPRHLWFINRGWDNPYWVGKADKAVWEIWDRHVNNYHNLPPDGSYEPAG